MNQRWLTTLAAIAALGCGKPDSNDDSPKEAPKGALASKPAAPDIKDAAPDKQGTSGRHRQQEGSDWVPAEFKKGRAKWKESAVYVDGVPYAEAMKADRRR